MLKLNKKILFSFVCAAEEKLSLQHEGDRNFN